MGLFSEYPISVRTYHYSSKRSTFETSLDVYAPQEPNGRVVALVVGSAWLGHNPVIYRPTSWWNSSGPRTVAKTGATCICIRHRGAFFYVPSVPALYCLALVSSTAACVAWCWIAVYVMMGVIAFYCLMRYLSIGDATFDDMVDDVAEAVRFIEHELEYESILFGGYSSGAHVATTLLQRWESYNLGKTLVSGVVLLSGVLAVYPTNVLANHASVQHGADDCTCFSNLVMYCVWGPSASYIPSPIAGELPKLPHLLIGCAHETFGISFLQVFFASQKYHDKLLDLGVYSLFKKVRSDHWSILNSTQLLNVLKESLPKLGSTTNKKSQSIVGRDKYSQS